MSDYLDHKSAWINDLRAQNEGDVAPESVPYLRLPANAVEIRGAGWTTPDDGDDWNAFQVTGAWALVFVGFLGAWTLALLALWALWSGAWRFFGGGR